MTLVSGNGKLVVAEFYSGSEIFIANPGVLSASAFPIYWYGNNVDYYQDFLALDFYAAVITDATVRSAVLAAVQASLADYVAIYEGQPNINLVGSLTPAWDGMFADLNHALDITYAGSASQIDTFFANLHSRIVAIHNELAAFSVFPS